MRKNNLVKLESSDGEIHFQECKTDSCSKAQKYSEEDALELAKNEAKKKLILQRE